MPKRTIKHQALLDLEAGMVRQLSAPWEAYWTKASRAIGVAADEGDWAKAHELVDGLDMSVVLDKKKGTLRSFGMAAVLLGASRFARVEDTAAYADPPLAWLEAADKQAEYLIGTNATLALRHELHLILDKRERAEVEQVEVSKAVKGKDKYKPVRVRQLSTLARAMRASGGNRAASYLGLAANLHVSRLSSAGFFLEAASRGQKQYQVNEELDGRTCPVCLHMHGRTFPVASGIVQLTQVFNADPSTLATVAPWPKQTKAGVAAFLRMGTDELLESRFMLPPYHPGCRGIVVPAGEVEEPVTIEQQAVEAVSGFMSYDVLADRLFGNRSDLVQTARLMAPAGVAAAYAVTDPDPDDEQPDIWR